MSLVGLFGGIYSDSTCFWFCQIWLRQVGGNVAFYGSWFGSCFVRGDSHIRLCWWLGDCLSLLDLLFTFFRIRCSCIRSSILRGLSLIQLGRIFAGILGEIVGDWLGGNACPSSLGIRLCNLSSCGSLSVILHHWNIIILSWCIYRLCLHFLRFLLRHQLIWLDWLWLWLLWWLLFFRLLLRFFLGNWLLFFGLLFLGWIYRWRILLGWLRWLRWRLWFRLWLLFRCWFINWPWQRFYFLLNINWLLNWLCGFLL